LNRNLVYNIVGVAVLIGLIIYPISMILLTDLISESSRYIAVWIGLATIVTLMSIGMWRIAVEGPSQIYCKDCCNPDHWAVEDRVKLTAEQYETMKKNVERGKIIE